MVAVVAGEGEKIGVASDAVVGDTGTGSELVVAVEEMEVVGLAVVRDGTGGMDVAVAI